MTSVLVIDDNNLERKIARDSLTSAGFVVHEAPDGPAGLRTLYDVQPDLVLLDVVMPVMDGWETCARIRDLCGTPIILITSLDREEDMIKGLDLGADDFVSKPISPKHLIARIRAVLRRVQSQSSSKRDVQYDDGRLRIDASRHEVWMDETAVELTATEFRLLLALVDQPGHVHSYGALLSSVWGPEYTDDIDFLRVYVWRLRKKIEPDPNKPQWLINERGFGYRFVARRS